MRPRFRPELPALTMPQDAPKYPPWKLVPAKKAGPRYVFRAGVASVLAAGGVSFLALGAGLAGLEAWYEGHPTYQNLIYALGGGGLAAWLLGLLTLPLLGLYDRTRRRRQAYRLAPAVTDDPSIGFMLPEAPGLEIKTRVPRFYLHRLTNSRGRNFVSVKPHPLYVPVSHGRLADLMHYVEEQAFPSALIYGRPDLANYYFNNELPFLQNKAGECVVIAIMHVQNGPTAPDVSLYRHGFGWRSYHLRNNAPEYEATAYGLLLDNLNMTNWPLLSANELDAKATALMPKKEPPAPVPVPRPVAVATPVPLTPSGVPVQSVDEVASLVEQRLDQKAKAHATDQLINVLNMPRRN